jgi:hypothetical protein
VARTPVDFSLFASPHHHLAIGAALFEFHTSLSLFGTRIEARAPSGAAMIAKKRGIKTIETEV